MEKILIKCAPLVQKLASEIIRSYFPGWPF